MSRAGSLDLIQEVEDTLAIMVQSQEIKPVKVKAMLEHLRSSLEYLANDAFDKHRPSYTSARPKIYFPFGEKKFVDNFFVKKLGIADPSSSALYAIFNSIQSYHTGETWLDMMCNLTNEVKHRNPLPLREEEVATGVNISAGGVNLIHTDGSSNIIFTNNYVNGEKTSDFTFLDGKFNAVNNGTPINLTLTTEKKIKFHGVDYEVIPFMQLCVNNIKTFINTAYDSLEAIP